MEPIQIINFILLHLLNPFFALNPVLRAKLWQIINLYEPQCVFFVLNSFLLKAVQRDIIILLLLYSFPKSVQDELNE